MARSTIKSNIETCLEDAEWNHKLAKLSRTEGAPNRITVSLCINAFIRATDCLCWLYNGNRCKTGRSHSLHTAFEELYNKKDLPEKYSKYKDTLKHWVAKEKTKAQYQGKNYSKDDIRKILKQTKRYINNCVKKTLKDEDVLGE